MDPERPDAYPRSDLAPPRRLERAEARSNVRLVEARAEVSSDLGTRWIEVAGAHAVFDGVRIPLTRTFGPGLFEPGHGFRIAYTRTDWQKP